MAAQHIPRLTAEKYLEIEREADFKSEFFGGEMYAMAGGTFGHALIGSNLVRELGQVLKGRGCSVMGSDLRVRGIEGGLYTYADVVVVCGPPKFVDGRGDTIVNPVLIVEVLSKSTEAHDRGLKFAQYRLIESLREYVLVSQTEPRVESFLRQPDGEWRFTEFLGLDSSCSLQSVDVTIPLAEIYAMIPAGTFRLPDIFR